MCVCVCAYTRIFTLIPGNSCLRSNGNNHYLVLYQSSILEFKTTPLGYMLPIIFRTQLLCYFLGEAFPDFPESIRLHGIPLLQFPIAPSTSPLLRYLIILCSMPVFLPGSKAPLVEEPCLYCLLSPYYITEYLTYNTSARNIGGSTY